MYSFTRKEQILILIIIFVIVSIFGYKLIAGKKLNTMEETELLEVAGEEVGLESSMDLEGEGEAGDPEPVEEKNIMVHISGQIHNPGLLELESGGRINDAVVLAGGLKNEADIDRINLSKKVEDEEKIYIPAVGEELEEIAMVGSTSSTEGTGGKSSSGAININNCTEQELISLPGIGEVTAGKIINYRQESQFQKIEDIMQVSGIGSKKFEAIQDLIIVK